MSDWNGRFLEARNNFRRYQERRDSRRAVVSRAFSLASLKVCGWLFLPVGWAFVLVRLLRLGGWLALGLLLGACIFSLVYASVRCLGLKVNYEK